MIMAYSKLLLVSCALAESQKGKDLRKIIHICFKSYNIENRIGAEFTKYTVFNTNLL